MTPAQATSYISAPDIKRLIIEANRAGDHGYAIHLSWCLQEIGRLKTALAATPKECGYCHRELPRHFDDCLLGG